MTTILVTGGSGQLATAIGRAALGRADRDAIRVVGRPALDFDRPDTLGALFADPPRLLINTAAWTAVDAAETEPQAASRANAEGPARLAVLCQRHGTRLIHLSTDYVFDGQKGAPYVERDATNPTGIYGRTKLAGEHAVLESCPDAAILRTAWVYAEGGRNFVRTMLNAARKTPSLRVVADQRGNPTNADDLARAVLGVADAMLAGAPGGIFHAAGTGEASWYGFAQAIFDAAGPLGWPVPAIAAITTAEYPTPARRPADSRLDCAKLANTFGIRMPPWQPSLQRAIRSLCADAMAA
jgi:dTDP-4-dehydrorhamnose reductase